MKEYALALDLKDNPEAIEKYRQHHQAVWPEVEEALRAVGIINMKIWQLGNRLFMRYTAPNDFDPEKDMVRYAKMHPRIAEWEALMAQFQQPLPQAGPGEKWLHMEKVFELNPGPDAD